MLNPTITLAQIRAARPCADGWTKLLAGLGYNDGHYDPDRIVSLGDVATINNAADALWCVRALNWSDVAVRRAVIAGAVLPSVTRALKHTTDKRVHDCVDSVKRWCAGDYTIDLAAVRKEARTVRFAPAADAAAAYAAAYAAAAYAAADADAFAAATLATYAYAALAAYAAFAVAVAVADAEREQQRQDIIAAFPRVTA